VKAGAIIPTQEVKSHIGTETPENIAWEVYPGGDSDFTLYEDDGESYQYLEGKIARTVIECEENNSKIKITVQPRKGGYRTMPKVRTHSFKIFHSGKLSLENKGVSWSFNKEEKLLTIDKITETNKKIVLTINIE